MLTLTGAPTGSTVELNWLPPLHPNGAIRYEIEYEPAMTPGDLVKAGHTSNPYFTLTLPNEFVTYKVKVAAVNTQGRTDSNVLLECQGKSRESGKYVYILYIPIYMLQPDSQPLTRFEAGRPVSKPVGPF